MAAFDLCSERETAPGTSFFREQDAAAPTTAILSDCWMVPFEDALPVRDVAAFKGQRNSLDCRGAQRTDATSGSNPGASVTVCEPGFRRRGGRSLFSALPGRFAFLAAPANARPRFLHPLLGWFSQLLWNGKRFRTRITQRTAAHLGGARHEPVPTYGYGQVVPMRLQSLGQVGSVRMILSAALRPRLAPKRRGGR